MRRTSDQSPRVQSSKPFSFTLFLRRSCSAAVHATPSSPSPPLSPDHGVVPQEPRSSPLPLYPAAADDDISSCCPHPPLFPLPDALCHMGCGTDGGAKYSGEGSAWLAPLSRRSAQGLGEVACSLARSCGYVGAVTPGRLLGFVAVLCVHQVVRKK